MQEAVVSQFALKKAALEGRIAEMDAELDALDQMDKALEGQDRPSTAAGTEGEEAAGIAGEGEGEENEGGTEAQAEDTGLKKKDAAPVEPVVAKEVEV